MASDEFLFGFSEGIDEAAYRISQFLETKINDNFEAGEVDIARMYEQVKVDIEDLLSDIES
jgi:hypothetical protein